MGTLAIMKQCVDEFANCKRALLQAGALPVLARILSSSVLILQLFAARIVHELVHEDFVDYEITTVQMANQLVKFLHSTQSELQYISAAVLGVLAKSEQEHAVRIVQAG